MHTGVMVSQKFTHRLDSSNGLLHWMELNISLWWSLRLCFMKCYKPQKQAAFKFKFRKCKHKKKKNLCKDIITRERLSGIVIKVNKYNIEQQLGLSINNILSN